jgi:hypothetical protein
VSGLYNADGSEILPQATESAPIALSPPIPMPNAIAGAVVVAQNDGMTVVWPLSPDDCSMVVMDFGNGPEPVVLARSRAKYTHTETGVKHLAAVPHAEVPGWLADFYREGDVHMEGAPSMAEGSMVLVNMGIVPSLRDGVDDFQMPPPPDVGLT